jgi:MFS family permease
MSTRARSVFSNRSFSLFYTGQALSFVGDGLRIIAIPLLVYHLTGSALAIGVTYALELGPFALFGLLGGSLADRIDRRRLMIVCDFIRFFVLALFAAGYAFGFLNLWLLYSGIVAISISAAIFLGGQSSTIPYLLGKERVTKAMSALLVTEQSLQMIVPPIGGALFAVIGPLPALAINAFTYLCSQISIASVHTCGPDRPSGLPSLREIGADIVAGFRFLFAEPALRAVATSSLLFNFFGFMTGAVFIPFLKRDFGASDLTVGYALGVGAIGAVAGSWLGGRLPHNWPFGRVLITAYVIDGLLFVPVMISHNLIVVIVFLTLTNGCVLLEITQIVGWRVRLMPEDMIGRVSGAARLISLAGTVPGAILGGALADHYGARVPIIVSGIGYLAIAGLGWLRPALRNEAR